MDDDDPTHPRRFRGDWIFLQSNLPFYDSLQVSSLSRPWTKTQDNSRCPDLSKLEEDRQKLLELIEKVG